jgi:tagatose 6-phosphate kinase
MFLCIGPTPAAQRVMVFRKLALDAVNRAGTTLDGAAGKSVNVAKVLRSLGQPVLATGFLGGERGQQLRGMLVARGVELDFVTVNAPTRLCTTVIDQTTGTITELVEESRPVTAEDYEQLAALVARRLAGCRAAIMSGTLTPGGPVDFYCRCARQAREAGALAIVDARGPALLESLPAQPAVVKPNRSELAATVGHELPDESAVFAAMRELQARGAQQVVVTAGSEPVLASDGQRRWRIASAHVQTVNPIGSGDAFTAALVWRLVSGDGLDEACRWGAAAGAANALTLMPGELDPKEMERLAAATKVENVPA